LHRLGRIAYVAKRKPLLSPAVPLARPYWLRLTSNHEWRAVIFTDEVQVVSGNKGPLWVRCLASERYQNDALAPRFRKEHGFHVWAGTWHGGRTPLIKLDLAKSGGKRAGFTSELYIQQIINPVLKPAYQRLRNRWRGYCEPVIIQDNSRVH
ncbi:hypothetical protein CC85DRAFT_226108, partial [Cutaneotrichosporon oleaginosum]